MGDCGGDGAFSQAPEGLTRLRVGGGEESNVLMTVPVTLKEGLERKARKGRCSTAWIFHHSGRVRRGMSPRAGPCKASWPVWFPLGCQEAVLGRVNPCIPGEIAQRWAGPEPALLEGRAAQGKRPKEP